MNINLELETKNPQPSTLNSAPIVRNL